MCGNPDISNSRTLAGFSAIHLILPISQQPKIGYSVMAYIPVTMINQETFFWFSVVHDPNYPMKIENGFIR